MRNFLLILTLLVLFVLAGTPVQGQKLAGQSAVLVSLNARENDISLVTEEKREIQKRTIKAVLEKYNSPMVDEVDTYMKVCEQYQLNCYLLPAISGVESGFGKAMIKATYNPFGWGGGTIYFDSWSDGINTVGKSLRERYIDRGAVTLDGVGKIYAASPTWSEKVRKFMNEFEREEERQTLNFTDDSVEL